MKHSVHARCAPALAPVLLLLAPTAALASAPAPWADRSEAEIRADIEFARGLATDWQYVDFAEEVIEALEAESLDKSLGEELDLVKCDIYAESARREGDAELRDELYLKAVEAYRDYMDEHPVSEFIAEAERSYVDICNAYGSTLERRFEEAVGEEATEIRGRMTEILEEALSRTSRLIDDLEQDDEPSEADRVKKFKIMYARGQMLHTLAKTSDEGAFFFSQAEQVLEKLAFEAGETSPQGLFAYLELAAVHMSQGNHDDAAAFAEFVVNVAMPIDDQVRRDNGWDELTPDERARRWIFVERGTAPLVEAYVAAGYPEDACRWALHFYNSWKREGFGLSKPSGYMALLASARTLLDSGGFVGGSASQANYAWFETEDEMKAAGFSSRRDRRTSTDMALSIAQTVNVDNRGNTLQIHAQKLISDVISRPGIEVSPDVLFEAAEGDYNNKSYLAAIEAYKRVLRSLESQDEASRQEYGSRVHFRLGECHRKLDRPLEAAMAFREGIVRWKGDPEFDPRNASAYHRMMGEVVQVAPGVAEFTDLRREAETLRLQNDQDNAGDVAFTVAKRAYDGKDYGVAREKFLAVPADAGSYEKAISYAALCLYKEKDYAGAEAEFLAYLNEFVPDTINTPTSVKQQAARREAIAQAEFYLGRMAYTQANQGKVPYDKVIDILAGYEDRHPDQTSYAPNALYMTLMSHFALKDMDAVKRVHGTMVELFPKNENTGKSATKIANALAAERDALEESGGDAAEIESLTRDVATFRRIANSLDDAPGYDTLRAESLEWYALGEWDEAERVLTELIDRHEGGADDSQIQKHVKRDLGEVLLAQKKVQEAFDLLHPLVPDPDDDEDDRKPSSRVTKALCQAITGWVEENDQGQVVVVPGVGGAENLDLACKYLVKLTTTEARDNKWECSWYEMKFLTAYGYYQHGQVDSAKLDSAKSQIQTLRTELGDGLDDIRDKCGNDDLRERFNWLWKKL